jgi:toxin ParE1/3/4
MDIVWRRQAERDLEHAFDFILQHNPRAARHLSDRIERRIEQLRGHPYMGRPGRVPGTRELIVAGTPYVVAYRATASQVDVLAILHAARRWPATIGSSPAARSPGPRSRV